LGGKMRRLTMLERKGIIIVIPLIALLVVISSVAIYSSGIFEETDSSDAKNSDDIFTNTNLTNDKQLVVLAAGPTTLTAEILSWEYVVIDHNKPHLGEGMNDSTVQIQICNTGVNDTTNVTATFAWNSTANSSYIYLHPNEFAVKNIGTIRAGECRMVFFEVSMIRDKNAQLRTRAFTVNITSDETTLINTSQTLILEISQEQNQDSSELHRTAGALYPICRNFTISFWMNITRQVTYAAFPVVYDPGIIELVNASLVVVLPTGNVTLDAIYTDNPDYARADHIVYYTFHAIGDGSSPIIPVISDSKTNFHYNAEIDYGWNVTVCTEPPTINKTVGNPNCTIILDEEYCVTTSTPITIDANASCCDLTEVMYNNGSGWINITDQLPFTHYFDSECTHWLNITAKDCLNNTAYDNQTFYVDDTPPAVTKTVGDPKVTITPGEEYCVTTSTEINLTWTSGGCCPSSPTTTIMYRIWAAGSGWGAWTAYTPNISFAEDCKHYLEINASDCLGNQWFDNETFWVNCNSPQLGRIIVHKETLPDGSPQTFTFTPDWDSTFTLTDGQSNTSVCLAPGTYAVGETVPASWQTPTVTVVENINTNSPDNGTLNLEAGETIWVNFTNTQLGEFELAKLGEFELAKAMDWTGMEGDPADVADETFTITVTGPSYPGGQGFTFDLYDH